MKRQIILIAHNIRSTHNVGSLLRTADGLGVEKVYFTGYTPYPAIENDSRLPHLAAKIDKQITKTALGAEKSVPWHYEPNLSEVIEQLKLEGYEVVALEQSPNSIELESFKPTQKLAVVVGNEVDGLAAADLKLVDQIIEIRMLGKKESLNVTVAAAIALHVLNYF